MSDCARRSTLRDVGPQPETHAGLWLDRYLERQTRAAQETSANPKTEDADSAKEADSKLVRQVEEQIRLSPHYRTFLLHKLAALLAPGPGRFVIWRVFRTLGRVVVGLGQSGVLENGITLDRTWGVPILPGSSLKGVAAATAHKLVEDPAWHKDSGENRTPGPSAAHLFGTTERAGKVCFLDGLWLPVDDSGNHGLHADVITVHNRDYYQGHYNTPTNPDGRCSPVPVSFLSASGDFLVAVECSENEREWAESALQLLEIGLLHLGIGAKTNAGYGRLQCEEKATERWASQLHAEMQRIEDQRALQSSTPQETLGVFFDRCATDPDVILSVVQELAKGQPQTAAIILHQSFEKNHGLPVGWNADKLDPEWIRSCLVEHLKAHSDWNAALSGKHKIPGLNVGTQKLKEYGNILGLLEKTEKVDQESSPENDAQLYPDCPFHKLTEEEKSLIRRIRTDDGALNMTRLEEAVTAANSGSDELRKRLLSLIVNSWNTRKGRKNVKGLSSKDWNHMEKLTERLKGGK